MALKDYRGNELTEGEHVVVEFPAEMCMARIAKIAPILERGPFQGGMKVTLLAQIEYPLPPGHNQLPGFKAVDPPQKEEEKSPLAP